MKLHRVVEHGSGAPIGWAHWCPGCKECHVFNVEQPTKPYPEYEIAGGCAWAFNGNAERPSFTPSMHIQTGGWKRPDGSRVPKTTCCHYILTDGQIQFCGDSPHELSGKVVPLPDYPERYTSSTGARSARTKRLLPASARPAPPVALPATPTPEAIYQPIRYRRD